LYGGTHQNRQESTIMKKIECIIAPKKFAELESALRKFGIRGMTVADVRGFGNEQTRPESFLFLPKTKVELYCMDQDWLDVVNVIQQVCRTGNLGDGKIAVYEIHELIRVRTGEAGEVAV
jgi:nitrogen regulatory protein P-II 1